MATVYRAFDPNFNRDVAIKVLPREMMHNLKFLVRFKRELKTIAQLEHPVIVPVYDVGEEDGQPYFVMRYMAGGSLASMIEKGKFSLQDTARIIERIAQALDYAHKKGIIHRDLKPDNILFDAHNNPYISDFGVAKLTDASFSATGAEAMVGTPGYMSPEQAGKKPLDGRSDVYGLGVLIYQMLTGKQPYEADTPMALIVKHLQEPIPNILEENPDLPPSVDTIIKTAMAKNPEERYATPIDLALALNKAAFGENRIFAPASAILDRPTMPYTRSSHKGWWMIGGIAALLLFFGSFLLRDQLLPFLVPASSPTLNLTPLSTTFPPTETITPAPTPTPPLEPTPIPNVPTVNPYPGGADLIAFLSGNDLYLMNIDGSNLLQVRTDNSPKSNLQWIDRNRLVYLSRNCAFLLDAETKQTREIACFNSNETLEGFRVSPDGKLAAVSIYRTLNILPFDLTFFNNVISRFNLIALRENCFYNQYAFREVLWSSDGQRIAARVVDTRVVNSDQIFLLSMDIPNCATVGPSRMDRIPGTHIDFEEESTKRIASFDWDGKNRFLLNDSIRNDGFGNLYFYNSETKEAVKINPINGLCCYRDARWSPDGTYILFAFQRFDASTIELYYIPFDAVQSGGPFTPIDLPGGFFSTSREKPQPALRPAP